MFEYTSKIPVKEIEQKMKEIKKEEEKEEKIISPYTMEVKNPKKKIYIIAYGVLILVVFLIVVWSLKQLTLNRISTNEISYVKEQK